MIDGDFLVDCTDEIKSQINNQNIAKKRNMTYLKAGYNGTHMSIHNSVAEWGEAEDGYTKTPSWSVPAIMVASLTVAKIMKYSNKTMSCDIKDMFIKM